MLDAIAAIVLGAAAAASPSPSLPPTPAPTPPSIAPLVVDTTASLQKVSLPDALKLALDRNPSVQTARLEIERAEAQLLEARAGSLPTIAVNGTYTHLDRARERSTGPTTPPLVITPQDTENANGTLTVPLFQPAKWGTWMHAEDLVHINEASSEDVRRTIAYAVGQAYVAVATQAELVRVDNLAVASTGEHRRYAATRLSGGIGNKLDLARAQQAEATARAQLEKARTGLVKAREALGVLLGLDHAVDIQGADIPPGPPTVDEALRDAQTRRPDLQALKRRYDLAHAISHEQWVDYLPGVNGVYQQTYNQPTTFAAPNQTSWQVQLLLSWTLYDGGLRYGQEREQRINTREAKVALDGATRQAAADVRGSFDAVHQADAELSAAQDAAKTAHEALDLTVYAYEHGATNDLEVIDAEQTALTADTNAALASDDARNARLSLLSATGLLP